jgi:hypothetical protein
MKICRMCHKEKGEEFFWYQSMDWPWCDECRLYIRGAPYPIHDIRCHGCSEKKCKTAYKLLVDRKRGDYCFECRYQYATNSDVRKLSRDTSPISRSKFFET